MQKRVTQLEELVARQAVDIKRLQEECRDLTEAAAAFAKVVELLRASGLNTDDLDDEHSTKNGTEVLSLLPGEDENGDNDTVVCVNEDSEIFGTAPSNVMDAADTAGAAILAALLGGQQRLLVDVRDAELTSNADTLVQFIELAILPVAAGLEGLRLKRNRLKIVFPTVKQLLQYRKTMALAAPEVVALSTLNLDPVEPHDNLVVIVAPAPDDEEGCQVMNQLLQPPEILANDDTDVADDNGFQPMFPSKGIRQPVVVLNPHMVPMQGPAASYEVAYQLRLLSVQYMSSQTCPGEGYVQHGDFKKTGNDSGDSIIEADVLGEECDDIEMQNELFNEDSMIENIDNLVQLDDVHTSSSDDRGTTEEAENDEEALEAAMQHAHEVNRGGGSARSVVKGTTRAMVIRAYHAHSLPNSQ